MKKIQRNVINILLLNNNIFINVITHKIDLTFNIGN